MQGAPQQSRPPSEAFVSRLHARVDEIPAKRRQFVDWMRRVRLDSETIGDLEVVFSELVTNAVAASGTTSDHVQIRAQVDGAVLLLEVSNATRDPETLPLSIPDLDDPLRASGRGLLITRAFVDSMDIEIQHPDRLVVRCCRTVAGISRTEPWTTSIGITPEGL